jgi:hypothetical protein
MVLEDRLHLIASPIDANLPEGLHVLVQMAQGPVQIKEE